MDDPVKHPSHYTQYEHEVIELTGKLMYNIGNIVKYILRAPYKGYQRQDLQKAKEYLSFLDPKYDRVAGIDPELVKSYQNINVTVLVLGLQDACALTDPVQFQKQYEVIRAAIDTELANEIDKVR